MSGDIRSAFITLALSLPAIVLCLSIHETAHGGAAYLLGDRTARDSGRVTLSPMAHIDPIGFLCLLLFGFGWARPVPVNIANFRNRRWGMALTALAGPVSNFITAFIAYCLFDKNAVQNLMQRPESLAEPWFGQLMRTPQIFAYIIQLDRWFRHYHVKIV